MAASAPMPTSDNVWFSRVRLSCYKGELWQHSQSGAQPFSVWHSVSGACSRRSAPGLIEAQPPLLMRRPCATCSRRSASASLKHEYAPAPCGRWRDPPAFSAGPH